MSDYRRIIIISGSCNIDVVATICERYPGADVDYECRFVTFDGSPERYQELLRAIRAVEGPVSEN